MCQTKFSCIISWLELDELGLRILKCKGADSKAVIPGIVAEIGTKVGKTVKQGDVMMILETMKMLNRIMAPQDGTIKAIRVATGEKVAKGQMLIEIA